MLVKKAGKLLPEIRIEGKTVLHYVGEKLHIRRFDPATNKVIDASIEENELGQELTNSIKYDKFSKLIFRNVSFEQFKMTFKATEKEYQEAFLLWGNEQWKELNGKHPKLAVFCGYRIVATFAQKRCLH